MFRPSRPPPLEVSISSFAARITPLACSRRLVLYELKVAPRPKRDQRHTRMTSASPRLIRWVICSTLAFREVLATQVEVLQDVDDDHALALRQRVARIDLEFGGDLLVLVPVP
ncbi:hypothetical protein OG508_14235 [Streptomyces sp. NBC_01108]|uniref:hypothetical protein n=1 Tax=Streptomyces sp. NBC_01108 TaxID=2903751 RepID=UPI003872BF96|nr:hypothetical protein OG508_14235 [Streptomyces sp. NBC_01108]